MQRWGNLQVTEFFRERFPGKERGMEPPRASWSQVCKWLCFLCCNTQYLRWELKGGKVRFESLPQRFPSMFNSLEARFLGLYWDRILWRGACGRVNWSSHESWGERWKGRGKGLNIPFEAISHVIYFLQLSLKPSITSQESVKPWPHELTNTFLRPQQSWLRHLSDVLSRNTVMPGTKSLTQRFGGVFKIKTIIIVFLGVLPTEEAASVNSPGRRKSQSSGPHLWTLADSLVKCGWSRQREWRHPQPSLMTDRPTTTDKFQSDIQL